MSVRLFLGGLPLGISPEDLAARFAPFGTVEACEIPPPKEYKTLNSQETTYTYPRNFGFITLQPKDEQNLRRALQVYNGCKWRGSVLRCYIAKTSGVETVLNEIEAEKQPTSETQEAACQATTAPGSTLRIRKPFSRELVSVTLGGKQVQVQRLEKPSEPEAQPVAAAALWQALEAPQGDRYTYERLLQKEAQARRDEAGALSDDADELSEWVSRQAEQAEAASQPGQGKGQGKEKAGALAKSAPTKRAAPTVKRQQQQQQQQQWNLGWAGGNEPESLPEPAPKRLRTVDFLTAEDAPPLMAKKQALDLSRFGSDSSDDERSGSGHRLRIPQVDGAGDSSDSGSSSESDSESGGGGGTGVPKAGGSGPSGDGNTNSAESESESESDSDVAAARQSSGSQEVGAADVEEELNEEDAAPALPALASSRQHGGRAEEDVAWLKGAFPAGAVFFQREPMPQVEAAWRAGREAATRDYREKRRQATRHAARPAGGKRGRR